MRKNFQKVRCFSEILPWNFKILRQFFGILPWNNMGNTQYILPLTHQNANALRQNPQFRKSIGQVYRR